MSKAEKALAAERLAKSCDSSVDSYAQKYCEANGIKTYSVDEARAYWYQHNAHINDMFFLDFKVDCISDSFFEVARQNAVKLLHTAEDMGGIYHCLGRCSGTMVFADCLAQYAIQEDCVSIYTDYRNGGERGYTLTAFGKDATVRYDVAKLEELPELGFYTVIVLAILILKKHGDIETQLIGANVRRKALHSDEIIMNSAPFPITQVDSMWLRTIIRTEGFLVRGHFRLQPCGERHRDRKLIYIKPFQKYGYVRRAGKLIAEERAFTAA